MALRQPSPGADLGLELKSAGSSRGRRVPGRAGGAAQRASRHPPRRGGRSPAPSAALPQSRLRRAVPDPARRNAAPFRAGVGRRSGRQPARARAAGGRRSLTCSGDRHSRLIGRAPQPRRGRPPRARARHAGPRTSPTAPTSARRCMPRPARGGSRERHRAPWPPDGGRGAQHPSRPSAKIDADQSGERPDCLRRRSRLSSSRTQTGTSSSPGA